MATDQFNVRLRDGLARQVRVRAAQLGCQPRDVIEAALEAAGFRRDVSGVAVDAGQLALAAPESSEAENGQAGRDGAVDGRGKTAGSRSDSRPPRRARPAGASPPNGAAGLPTAAPAGDPDRLADPGGPACPECAGELQDYHDGERMRLKCEDCGYLTDG